MGRYGTQDGSAHSDDEEQNIDSNAMESRRLSAQQDSANHVAKLGTTKQSRFGADGQALWLEPTATCVLDM